MSRKIEQKERFARRKNFFGRLIKMPTDPIRWNRMKREAKHQLDMRGDEFAGWLEMQYRADNYGYGP